MKRKKIIIISRTIYPLQAPRSFRATELAKEFAKKGHEVILYAVLGKYDYTEFENKYNIRVKNIGKMKFATMNSDSSAKQNFFIKACSKLFKRLIEFPDIELMFKIPQLLKKEEYTDILITVAIPHPIHWGAALYKSKEKINFPKTWIADCGDPYMGNKFHTKLFYFKFIEKWFCKYADYITIPIEGAKDAYYPEFHHKIEVIPQGFDFNEVKIEPAEINNDVLTFIYAGVFYKNVRDPRPFLKYLSKSQKKFKFVVYTKTKTLLEPYLLILKEKLEIRDYIPRPELIKKMSRANFLVNFENNNEVQSPSKLIDYAIADRPVLSVKTQTLDYKIINEFLEGTYRNQYKIENLGQYKISNVATQFLDLHLRS